MYFGCLGVSGSVWLVDIIFKNAPIITEKLEKMLEQKMARFKVES